ncbi:MAG: TonB-dependent receptor plug domain-containing protein [Bdellovibrionia bacterium]
MKILFVMLFTLNAHADSLLTGVVLEKGTRIPFAGAVIYVLPEKIRIMTGPSGTFETTLSDGEHSLVTNIPGYLKSSLKIQTPSHAVVEVSVEKSAYNPYETTVETKGVTVQPSQKSITASEASKIAGTGGDTLKAVQTLPGVARTTGGSSNVVIRGSDPDETGYLIDGHDIPLIFHFGGLASVVNTDLVDEIIYLPGGYGSKYGRANAGIIGVNLRDPKSDRLQGYAFADIVNAGFLIETPLENGWSLGVTARRSYIGDVIKAVAKDNPSFDMTVAPFYYDGLLTLSKKLSDTKTVRFTALGSYDELSFVLKEPVDTEPSLRGDLNNITKFYRLIGSYSDKISETDRVRFSTGYGGDAVLVNIGDIYLDRQQNVLSVNSDWEHRFSDRNLMRLGLDNQYVSSETRFRVPDSFSAPVSTNSLIEATAKTTDSRTAVFIEERLGLLEDPEKWILIPGLRLDRFKLTDENLASPRLSSKYFLTETFALRASSGYFVQPVQSFQANPSYGNPSIKSPVSLHYSVGFESEPKVPWLNRLSVEADLFYKDLQRQVVSHPTARYSTDGTGRAYGAEIFSRFEKGQWSGWLSYTYSKSTRQNPFEGDYTFRYDQTHNVNFILSFKTAARWEFGTRIRYVTGNPETPVIGSRFDSDNDTYVPIDGSLNSERLPAFFQADFRIDKKWVYQTWILNGYLDIINATNVKNVENTSYNYDYSEKRYVSGLPVIPSLGIKAEF